MPEFVAYYRVSTQRQGATGLGLEAQRTAVESFVRGVKGQIVGEYQEIESGRRKDRPKLNDAIQLARVRKATLVIAKLDRLARNVHFVSQLMEARVDFVAADMPHANRLTIHIIAAVAEYEREMIAKRTIAALQSAKTRGVALGNPNASRQALAASYCARKKADEFATQMAVHVRLAFAQGVTSLSGVARFLNARGVMTQRGCDWTAMGVSNLIARSTRLGVAVASK